MIDKITKYLCDSVLNGLPIYKGNEYSFELTVSDLLFQVSGLPDAYEAGKNNFKDRVIHEDFHYSFDEIVENTKHLKPHFKSRKMKRAHYADINFDILGVILERIMNRLLNQVYKHYIFEPNG